MGSVWYTGERYDVVLDEGRSNTDRSKGFQGFRLSVAAQANYSGLILHCAALHQCTPIFEYVGKRHHKKAFEGNMARVVLLALRFNTIIIFMIYTMNEIIASSWCRR